MASANPKGRYHAKRDNLRQRAASARAAAATLLRQAAADEAASSSVGGLPDASTIASSLDLTGMSMWELFSLIRVSDLVSDVCCAVSCQPRAASDEPAGVLIRWVEDVLDGIAGRCRSEASAREPEPGEAAWRLRALADWVIDNGEKNETLQLASDLAAFAERN